ncbi:MAG: hypothetical protein PHE48_04140 [Candidatus Daviesbacteria bacterium]|nr:hypothetical protein [Candidatus Daviesbacteria bacterium]
MKTLIIILIIASFMQTTILPIDLVLLILICRSYIKSDSANLYLAFFFGIFTSHLNLASIGFQSLIYLSLVEVTEILSKLRLAGNPLLIVPLTFFLITISQFANSILDHSSFEFSKVILACILSLPILFLVRLWEERFVIQKEIKLKM